MDKERDNPLLLPPSPNKFYFAGLLLTALSFFLSKWIPWYIPVPLLIVALAWLSLARKSIGIFVYGFMGVLTPLLVLAAFLFVVFEYMDDFN